MGSMVRFTPPPCGRVTRVVIKVEGSPKRLHVGRGSGAPRTPRLRHPGCCGNTVRPATRDETCSALLPYYSANSGRPDSTSSHVWPRTRLLLAKGSGVATSPSDLLSAHANTLSRGVRDRHVPRYRWSTQDPDLQGPQNATTPQLEGSTPYSDDHAACWGWRDAGAISARTRTMPRTTVTPDAIPHSVLPTVFDCCIPTVRGETTTSAIPCTCPRPSLCL